MIDMIYKVTLTIILVVFLTATGSSIAAVQQDLNNTNSYFDDITTVIAESNYASEVINECITEAAQNGYTLRVNVIHGSESGMMRYAEAEMDYKYNINLLGVSETKTKHKIF